MLSNKEQEGSDASETEENQELWDEYEDKHFGEDGLKNLDKINAEMA